ncbi:MAG TPA: MGMT family protein [Candidatus Eisenbacteria bacterium]|nr:MGMT family protein [Candidatus Eisenbacteria bacterium]
MPSRRSSPPAALSLLERSARASILSARSRPSAREGTHARILAVVRRIPRGKVATYGQVAALAGFPRQPRLAGYALHALPEGTPLPWHRVLGAGGRLTLMRLSVSSATTQRLRLEREGVRFDARWRVDMPRCGWRPGARAARARSTAAGR